MAVTSVKEIHDGRGGDEELTSQGRLIRRYVRVFRVVTDSNYDEDTTVKSHASIPSVGDLYPYDVRAYCQRIDAKNASFSKRVWIVTCQYSTEREISDNPLADPAEITWSTESYQRPYFADRNGYGIVNSAGDPYDPPIEGDDSRWGYTVKKNLSAVPTWILSYRDAVNSDTYVVDGITIGVGYAKIKSISISGLQERNGVYYRILSYTVHVDSAGWAVKLLDAGYREVDGTSGKLKNIRNDSDLELPPGPVLLDGSGSRLDNPSPSNAVFNTFNIYKSLPFSILPR